MSKRFLVSFILMVFLLVSCAKRGSITGGDKDIMPPVVLKTSPNNFSTNFDANEVTIEFDEYVKFKDIQKQLVVSPPLKYRPEITPTSISKKFKLKIKDTLQPNTTYNFNFGQSIEDNNEGNKLNDFRYVVSTGNYIDSLSVSGIIKDAYSSTKDDFISVLLYEINQDYSDSLVYKFNPRYITNTLTNNGSFTLENLKAGKYKIVALKDENGNNRFDPSNDKIGFLNRDLEVPTSEEYILNLFKENPADKVFKPYQETRNKLVLGYQGNFDSFDVRLSSNGSPINYTLSKLADKDSMQIWMPKIAIDSVLVEIIKGDDIKEFMVKLKDKSLDSLNIESITKNNISFRDAWQFSVSTPLEKLDISKVILKQDSLKHDFTYQYHVNNQHIDIIFDKDENKKYTLDFLPGAITDFYGETNDSLSFKTTTRSFSDFGNLTLKLRNVSSFPVLVELVDAKGKVKEKVVKNDESSIEFLYLNPAQYTLRIVYDQNNNGKWDTGSFLEGRQPEKIIYFTSPIDIRPNWDLEETFIITE